MINKAVTALLSIGAILLLSACGGSGGSGGSYGGSGGIERISFTELGLSRTVNEGDRVTLSLNVQGDTDNQMTYEWSVTYRNHGDVEFEGQNTDTITFIAPETTGRGFINVSVEMDLEQGNLAGITSDSISIYVEDLDPPLPDAVVENTNLPEVDAIDLSQITAESTWRKLEYRDINETIENTEIVQNYKIQERGIVHLKNNAGEVTEFLCYRGSSAESSVFDDVLTSLLDRAENECGTGKFAKNYSQSDSAFKIEATCDDEPVFVNSYTKLSDDLSKNYGSIEMSFDSYDDIETQNNVCGYIVETSITRPGLDAEASLNYAFVGTEYQGVPLYIGTRFTSEIDFVNSVNLRPVFNPDGFNTFTIYSTALTTVNSRTEDENGRFSVNERSAVIEGDFDVDITDSNGGTENLEGEFTLSFE